METNGVGVEAVTNHQGLPQSSSPVSVTTTNITQSLSLLQRASTLSATSSNTCTKPRSKVSDPLSGTPLTTTTATKKTTRMLQKYRPNLKGKGWVHVDVAEEDVEEVDEVWEMQKKALLDSPTLGKRTRSGYRQATVRLPSPASSSSIKALRTSPSTSPTTRDERSLPCISQST